MNPTKIPNKINVDITSLFDLSYQKDTSSWVNWGKTVPEYIVPTGGSYTEVIVPNVDSIRVQFIIKNALMQMRHVLIVGGTGTGKSIMI